MVRPIETGSLFHLNNKFEEDRNVTVLAQTSQHRLQTVDSLKSTAEPHGIPTGELRQLIALDRFNRKKQQEIDNFIEDVLS